VHGKARRASGHGSVSLRVAVSDEMYFTGGSSLRDHPAETVVRVGPDGELREGERPPIQARVVAMHTALYVDRGGLRDLHPLTLLDGLCRGTPPIGC